MSKNRLEISDSTAISMPMKNLIAIVAAVSMGVWAYFGVLERITMLETTSKLAEKDLNQHVERLEADLTKNTEFRIKWPRGEMGTLPADSEQYMLIEDIYGSVEKIEKQLVAQSRSYDEVIELIKTKGEIESSVTRKRSNFARFFRTLRWAVISTRKSKMRRKEIVEVDKVVFKEVPVEVVRKEFVHIPFYTNDKNLLNITSPEDDLQNADDDPEKN